MSMFAAMTSDQRKFKCLGGSAIVLEGLVGAGKTTLGKSLQRYLCKHGFNVRFFSEFKNMPLLNLYISDMKKYAFSFQIIMARERMRIYTQVQEFIKSGGIAIIDRSLIGDKAFAMMQHDKKFFTDDEWSVYLDLIKTDMFEPSYIIYLDCPAKWAFERMRSRNIKSEVDGYTLSYFEDLEKKYNEIMSTVRSDNIIRINWTQTHTMVDGFIPDDICRGVVNLIYDKMMSL